MLATTSGVGPRYAGTYLAAAGIFPAIANILPWVSNNQGNDSRRGAGFVMLNVLGQCGPFVGTNIYPSNQAPYYVRGQSICAAFMFFTCLLALALRTLLVRENRRLDQQYGTLDEQRSQQVTALEGKGQPIEVVAGVENYGPMYRFVL